MIHLLTSVSKYVTLVNMFTPKIYVSETFDDNIAVLTERRWSNEISDSRTKVKSKMQFQKLRNFAAI